MLEPTIHSMHVWASLAQYITFIFQCCFSSFNKLADVTSVINTHICQNSSFARSCRMSDSAERNLSLARTSQLEYEATFPCQWVQENMNKRKKKKEKGCKTCRLQGLLSTPWSPFLAKFASMSVADAFSLLYTTTSVMVFLVQTRRMTPPSKFCMELSV